MAANDFLLNGGFALGGGLGSIPDAAPFSLGGAAPGVLLQGNTGVADMYGSALSPEMKQQMMPMGMENRDGQMMMGQQQAIAKPEQGMSNADMMKFASMAMQGFNRPQQGIQAPTQQIIRDNNQFRFAGNPQQQMAQALRNRG